MNVDTETLLANTNLQALLVSELGDPDRAGRWCCPFHQERTPSFGIVKDNPHLWHCFGCGKTGDAIASIRERRGLGFIDACKALSDGRDLPAMPGAVARPKRQTMRQAAQPSDTWARRAERLAVDAERELWNDTGDYLRSRGISEETARKFRLGWNPRGRYEDPQLWGLPADHKQVWIPAGLVIPWRINGKLWRVNVRRMTGTPKYCGPAGYKPGLFNADAVVTGKPVALVEGEIDAMLIDQAAGDLVTAVATGSTTGARVARWVYRLSPCPLVLLCFDRDPAGDDAADWWAGKLPHCKRWLPLGKDPGEMGQALRAWICCGLGMKDPNPAPRPMPEHWEERFDSDTVELLCRLTADNNMSDTEAEQFVTQTRTGVVT